MKKLVFFFLFVTFSLALQSTGPKTTLLIEHSANNCENPDGSCAIVIDS
ncbi:MAG: hypothetical protein QNK37_19370 [Acidobacteriota bacterium]|nr:hypothetical protein [Acidobacteriota bacterium]